MPSREADRIRTYLDTEGFTTAPVDPEVYANVLGLKWDETTTHSLGLLARLRYSAGVVVITGPEGAPFWAAVSPEVHVRVEPDGYTYRDRRQPHPWSLVASGLTETEANSLIRSYTEKGKQPTKKHKHYGRWEEAKVLEGELNAESVTAQPIILVDYDVPLWDVDEMVAAISNTDHTVALDWEWSIDPGTEYEPVGLSFADSLVVGYTSIWNPEGRDIAGGVSLRESVAAAQLGGGLSAIWHDARADLGTQHVGDPLALVPDYRGHDTKVMAYMVGERLLDLKTLTRKYLKGDPVEFGAFGSSLEHVSKEAQARYAGADTRNTFDLWVTLLAKLSRQGQLEAYETYERRLPPFIASMERYGTPIDIEVARELMVEYWTDAAFVREAVREATGYDISEDPATHDLLAEDFALGLRPGTLDQRVLTRYESGWVDVVLAYRRARTLGRNFLGAHLARWDAAGQPADYRLYPRFNQAGDFDRDDKIAPRGGRLSSSDPNLQNQPRLLRAIFIPPRGKVWWSFDYAQLELRIAAAASGDPAMVAAYIADPPLDLHQALIDRVFEDTGRVIPRDAAKGGNFSRKYGADYAQLRNILWKQRITVSNEVCKAIVESHDSAFPGWLEYADYEGAEALERGYGLTIIGDRRGYRPVDRNDLGSVAGAKRFYVNHSIQGTAALIVKRCMLDLAPVLLQYDAHCCNQTHDELNGWVDGEVVEEFLAAAATVAEAIVLPRGIHLKVESGYGPSWGDAH